MINQSAQQYLEGYCHVMALAWQSQLPNSKIVAHVSFVEEDDELDDWQLNMDDPYHIVHVWCETEDGAAYDALGKFAKRKDLLRAFAKAGGQAFRSGATDQIIPADDQVIEDWVDMGALKPFNTGQIQAAKNFIQDHHL
jgi:hypothetical protein